MTATTATVVDLPRQQGKDTHPAGGRCAAHKEQPASPGGRGSQDARAQGRRVVDSPGQWDIRAHTHRMPWHEFRSPAKTAEAHGLTSPLNPTTGCFSTCWARFSECSCRTSTIANAIVSAGPRSPATSKKAAWRHTHYRNERSRLADHWTYLHKARDPLLRWAGDGAITRAPSPAQPMR